MANAFKAGKVIAPDYRWTGDEPDWHNWQNMPIEKFMSEKRRMLNFYGYYLTSSDLRPAILAYMKRNKFSKEDISIIKNAPPSSIPMTAGKFIRALDQGMPSTHPNEKEYLKNLPFIPIGYKPKVRDAHDIIKEELYSILRFLKTNGKASNVSVKKGPKISIQDRLKNKVEQEVIKHLEKMLDDWIISDETKVSPISLTSYIRDGGIPAAGCKYIDSWLDKILEEFQGALDKSDPELVEGYSYLSKPALKNRISALQSLRDEVNKFVKTSKALKKPRKKKTKDASKQVANFKYQPNSKEYGLDSINPIRIVAAQTLFMFNTKARTLSVYYAENGAGFEVKGSGVKNFSSDSFTTTLRKPTEILNKIISSTPRQINKVLESITTKRRKANGRSNAQTVIFKSFEQRL